MDDLIALLEKAVGDSNFRNEFFKRIADEANFTTAQASVWAKGEGYGLEEPDFDRLRNIYKAIKKESDPYVITPKY